MVHIRNLSYDVLDGIMSHLAERPGDLITASLVSRSFWLAVVPIMYQTIVFDEYLAQKYPKVRISVVSPLFVACVFEDLMRALIVYNGLFSSFLDIITLSRYEDAFRSGTQCSSVR